MSKIMPHEQIIEYLKSRSDCPEDFNPSSYYISVFDFLDSMDELAETAKEFGMHGAITLPCTSTIFVFKIKSGHWVANYCYNIPDKEAFQILGFTENPDFPGENFHVNELLVRYKYKSGRILYTYDSEITDRLLTEESEEKKDRASKTTHTWTKYVMAAIMFLNTKYTEVREAKAYMLSDSLSKSRKKQRKHKYSTIKLTRTVYEQIESAQNSYTMKCPHFRRGHMRTLSNGKVIPVRECLINVKDDSEVEKLPFKVIK